MIGIYLGIIIFMIGAVMTLFINRNEQASMNGDFWDMPKKIKIGILFIIFGILLLCASVMFMFITNPVDFLNVMNKGFKGLYI